MISRPNVKINLGLNVLRKRADGYHDLETLFVPCFEISDVLEIVSGDDYSRTLSHLISAYGEGSLAQAVSPDGKLMITIARREGVDWDPLQDLCARAYYLLGRDYSLPPVKIFLEKLSPVGAGLGGGSSDAAFALKMLNSMFSLGLDDSSLAGYASELGSDCAFFVHNRPMFGEGRGEKLSAFPIDSIDFGQEAGSACRYVLKLVVPDGVAVSTAEAYKGIVPGIPEISLREILAMPVEQWKGLLSNDFENTVFKAHPELERIKHSLYDSGAVYASMSGSGSSLFALYERE